MGKEKGKMGKTTLVRDARDKTWGMERREECGQRARLQQEDGREEQRIGARDSSIHGFLHVTTGQWHDDFEGIQGIARFSQDRCTACCTVHPSFLESEKRKVNPHVAWSEHATRSHSLQVVWLIIGHMLPM